MATISAYVSDEIYDEAKQIADANHSSLSQIVKNAFMKIEVSDKNIELEKLNEISRIGNNLNQIARYCNSKKAIDTEVLKSLLYIETYIESLIDVA